MSFMMTWFDEEFDYSMLSQASDGYKLTHENLKHSNSTEFVGFHTSTFFGLFQKERNICTQNCEVSLGQYTTSVHSVKTHEDFMAVRVIAVVSNHGCV